MSVSGMVMNRFKIFRFDAIGFDAFVFVKLFCNVSHLIFDKLGIVVCLFSNELLVGAFE